MDIEIRAANNHKGKGLFAKKDFENGSIIFAEEPLVCCQFAWNETYGYKACNHCMRPLEDAEENARRLTGKSNLVLPYPHCCSTNKATITSCASCGVKYCNDECRVTAFNQYHRNVCLQTTEQDLVQPLDKLVTAWKQLHFPPETCNIMLLVRIMSLVQQSSNQQECLQTFSQFCHRTVNEDANLVHKLVGDQFIEQIDLLLNIFREAFSSVELENWLSPDGFRSLLALIGTNGQGVATSAISAWVRNCSRLPLSDEERGNLDTFIDQLYEDLDRESGSFLDNEGSALYVLQSACNHSCEPNAQPNFLHDNYKLSMVALNDIKCGDEIFVSYLDECHLARSRRTRQNILMENYLFRCDCTKCMSQNDDPDDATSSDDDDNDDEIA